MSNSVIKRVENDHLPDIQCTLSGVDVTGYTFELHIDYKPFPLIKEGSIVSAVNGTFLFEFVSNVLSTVDAAAESGDTTLLVPSADYADFPTSGTLVIGTDELREVVRYSSKTSPNALTLTDALTFDHAAGELVESLGDFRPGKHKAEISVINGSSKILTFRNLIFDVAKEVA